VEKSVSNSKLLDYIIERAESIKNNRGNKILTVNHIFAAVLEYIDGFKNLQDFSKYGDPTEAEALFEMMINITLTDTVSNHF